MGGPSGYAQSILNHNCTMKFSCIPYTTRVFFPKSTKNYPETILRFVMFGRRLPKFQQILIDYKTFEMAKCQFWFFWNFTLSSILDTFIKYNNQRSNDFISFFYLGYCLRIEH